MKKLLVLLLTMFAVSAALLTAPRALSQGEGKFRRVTNALPDRYIVVLKDDVPAAEVAGAAIELTRTHGGFTTHVYEHALRGFAVTMPRAAALALSRNPRVAYVEEEGMCQVVGTQLNPPWGLDRIDQRDRPTNGSYNYTYTGSGIRVYVLDTGVRVSHQDFGGRAFVGYDAFGGNGLDGNGHGTAVASLVAGSTHGSAKEATVVSVRVCDNNGNCPVSSVIAGINWVTSNQVRPAVANLSLAGPANYSLDSAVQNSISSGVSYVVGAGNAGVDAVNTSPAHVSQAITVGATDMTDTRAVFNAFESSNYGYVLDMFAPGKDVPAASFVSDTAVGTFGGTSAAAPYVAGVAAMYRHAQADRWFISPADVHSELVRNATYGRVSNPGPGSPNLLAFTGFDMRQCPYAGYCSDPNAGCAAAYCRAVGYVWSNCQCTYPRYP
ncbi:MAG: S8 family peptidase [Acidobacteriota bacterium]|nr:S8 family peptidase [Acidobacteriota bacterium]